MENKTGDFRNAEIRNDSPVSLYPPDTRGESAENRVLESERRFRETAELLPGIICESDLSMRLTYVNKKGLETLGFTQEQYAASEIFINQFIMEEDRQRAAMDIANVLGGDFGNPAEYRLRRPDGRLIDLLINTAPIIRDGKPCGLRYCIIDISDRKQAEQKLLETEERFKRMFDQSPIGIALCDHTGAVSEMNQSFINMFAAHRQTDGSCAGCNIFKAVSVTEEQRAILNQGCDIQCEGWCDSAIFSASSGSADDVSQRYFEWHVTLFGAFSGAEKIYLVQVQDITERKTFQEAAIQKAREAAQRAEALVDGLRKELLHNASFHAMVSRSPEMKRIFDILPEVAQSSAGVLVLGESGTGKELIARTLHELGGRSAKPFIAINCGALPDTLLEAELFGYKAGAFTDAKKDKPGKFALAEGGTLFLDEIGDVSTAMQVKLLRVLQEKTFEPLGGTASVRANVRVVAATNRNLSEMVKNGEFREDLFYRINILTITLPPLRKRRCDIPLLCNHFISLFNTRYGKKITDVSAEAFEQLLAHEFPGNIRELENIIEHAFIFCKSPIIQPEHLPAQLRREAGGANNNIAGLLEIKTFDELEKIFIENVLKETGGNKLKAAQRLGIDKSTLFRKLKKLGMQ